MPSNALDLSQFASYQEFLKATSSAAGEAAPALQSLEVAMKEMGRAIQGTLVSAFKSLGSVMDSCSKQVNSLGASIRGLVQAGLAGTQEGARMSFAWSLLTKQIARAC